MATAAPGTSHALSVSLTSASTAASLTPCAGAAGASARRPRTARSQSRDRDTGRMSDSFVERSGCKSPHHNAPPRQIQRVDRRPFFCYSLELRNHASELFLPSPPLRGRGVGGEGGGSARGFPPHPHPSPPRTGAR